MASQSKLPPGISDSTIRRVVTDLLSLYTQNRTRISRTIYITLFLALANRIRHAIAEQKAASARQAESRRSGTTGGLKDGVGGGKKRVELNREFFRNLMRLLRIVIPGWRSKELRLILSHSVFLVLRTLISLYVAELDGKLVSSLVRGRGKEFLKGLVWWMVVAVPATFTNSMVSLRAARDASWSERTNTGPKAVISSVQACAAVPHPPHQLHPQPLPLKHDLLRAIRA